MAEARANSFVDASDSIASCGPAEFPVQDSSGDGRSLSWGANRRCRLKSVKTRHFPSTNPPPLQQTASARVVPTQVDCYAMEPAILYVDDERANLDLFRRSFDEEFRVLVAGSGPTALELLEAGQDIGVLVSDQRMDPMTGIELLTRAAARWPIMTRVLLTAYSDRDLLLQAIQFGKVHDYVLKPWRADELGLRLRAALDAFK